MVSQLCEVSQSAIVKWLGAAGDRCLFQCQNAIKVSNRFYKALLVILNNLALLTAQALTVVTCGMGQISQPVY